MSVYKTGRTILVISDQHAHPDHNNDRADWLGRYIADTKPDVVVNLGDAADMPSLSAFDKGKASFHGNSYQKDIEAHLDFQERLWAPMKAAKKKQPFRVVLEGNHEHRLKKVLDFDPQMAGDRYGISFRNYDFDSYYHEVIQYDGGTPGSYLLDGWMFAHFFISGVMGRAIGGLNHGRALIQKNAVSSVCGHSHLFDLAVAASADGRRLIGCVAGVYQDFDSPWAGKVNNLWDRGTIVIHDAGHGTGDIEWLSIGRLKKAYGSE